MPPVPSGALDYDEPPLAAAGLRQTLPASLHLRGARGAKKNDSRPSGPVGRGSETLHAVSVFRAAGTLSLAYDRAGIAHFCRLLSIPLTASALSLAAASVPCAHPACSSEREIRVCVSACGDSVGRFASRSFLQTMIWAASVYWRGLNESRIVPGHEFRLSLLQFF